MKKPLKTVIYVPTVPDRLQISTRARRLVEAAKLFASEERATAVLRMLETDQYLTTNQLWPDGISDSTKSKNLAPLKPLLDRQQEARNVDAKYRIHPDLRYAISQATDALNNLMVGTTRQPVLVSIGNNDELLVNGKPVPKTQDLTAAIMQAFDEE